MHIGHLKNEPFVNAYKNLGFSTRNQMIDTALELLKEALAKKRRSQWRKEAHQEYAKAKMSYAWESIDGEDFETED